jgi:AcrR family transcriptional regulator
METDKRAHSGIAKRRAAAREEASDHYVARRRAIVQAAAGVFRTQGVAGTSIEDVARAAGVDRATLYYYVGGKDELFREVIGDAVLTNLHLAERIAARDDPPERKLQALIAELMASYAEFYPHIYVFLRESPDTISAPVSPGLDVLDLQRRFDRALTSIIRDGIDSGAFRSDVPPRLAAYAILGMLNWTQRWFHPDGPVEADDVASAFATIAVEGLRTR